MLTPLCSGTFNQSKVSRSWIAQYLGGRNLHFQWTDKSSSLLSVRTPCESAQVPQADYVERAVRRAQTLPDHVPAAQHVRVYVCGGIAMRSYEDARMRSYCNPIMPVPAVPRVRVPICAGTAIRSCRARCQRSSNSARWRSSRCCRLCSALPPRCLPPLPGLRRTPRRCGCCCRRPGWRAECSSRSTRPASQR